MLGSPVRRTTGCSGTKRRKRKSESGGLRRVAGRIIFLFPAPGLFRNRHPQDARSQQRVEIKIFDVVPRLQPKVLRNLLPGTGDRTKGDQACFPLGTMLLGASKAAVPADLGYVFILGVCIASASWWLGLTTVVTLFRAKIIAKIFRIINIVCGYLFNHAKSTRKAFSC